MRVTTILQAALAAALFSGLCGCGKGRPEAEARAPEAVPEPAPDHVVAMVNATPLTWAEMEKRAAGYLKHAVEREHLMFASNRLDEAKTYYRQNSVRAFVYKTIMMDEARAQGVKLTDLDRQEGLRTLAASLKPMGMTTDDFFRRGPMDEATMRREHEDGLVIDKLLRLNVRSKIKVDEAEIARATQQLGATNAVRRAKLETVRKQLLGGASFEDVARTVSEDSSAKSGGDLGEFGRGRMVKAFEDAAFSQKVGEIGPVVETRFGFHLIKVTAHNPAKPATASTPAVPETVRASHILIKSVPTDRKTLSNTYLRAQFLKASKAYYAELRAKAKPECYLYKDLSL